MIEPGSVVPSKASLHAWDAAWSIDEAVEGFLNDYGFERKKEHSRFVEAVAKTVQLAINRALEEARAAE